MKDRFKQLSNLSGEMAASGICRLQHLILLSRPLEDLRLKILKIDFKISKGGRFYE
jgi:hypothetical protein